RSSGAIRTRPAGGLRIFCAPCRPPAAQLLDELLERLVGLGTDYAALADHESRHAGDAILARLFPVGVDRGLVSALFKDLFCLYRIEADALCNLHKLGGIADVLPVDEVRLEERVVDRVAAGLRLGP